jgi:hypothetical protein
MRPCGRPLRAAVSGRNGYFKSHTEFLQDIRCCFHDVQVRVTSHNDADLWFCFRAQDSSFFELKDTMNFLSQRRKDAKRNNLLLEGFYFAILAAHARHREPCPPRLARMAGLGRSGEAGGFA